jgi:hypothetical protein
MKKNIDLNAARIISKKFCQDFNIPNCQIYYIDIFEDKDTMGLYYRLEPNTILMKEKQYNRIGTLVHELTHHLQHCIYDSYILKHSGSKWQTSKKKVLKWCKENISEKADWNGPLRAVSSIEETKKFKL